MATQLKLWLNLLAHLKKNAAKTSSQLGKSIATSTDVLENHRNHGGCKIMENINGMEGIEYWVATMPRRVLAKEMKDPFPDEGNLKDELMNRVKECLKPLTSVKEVERYLPIVAIKPASSSKDESFWLRYEDIEYGLGGIQSSQEENKGFEIELLESTIGEVYNEISDIWFHLVYQCCTYYGISYEDFIDMDIEIKTNVEEVDGLEIYCLPFYANLEAIVLAYDEAPDTHEGLMSIVNAHYDNINDVGKATLEGGAMALAIKPSVVEDNSIQWWTFGDWSYSIGYITPDYEICFPTVEEAQDFGIDITSPLYSVEMMVIMRLEDAEGAVRSLKAEFN